MFKGTAIKGAADGQSARDLAPTEQDVAAAVKARRRARTRKNRH